MANVRHHGLRRRPWDEQGGAKKIASSLDVIAAVSDHCVPALSELVGHDETSPVVGQPASYIDPPRVTNAHQAPLVSHADATWGVSSYRSAQPADGRRIRHVCASSLVECRGLSLNIRNVVVGHSIMVATAPGAVVGNRKTIGQTTSRRGR